MTRSDWLGSMASRVFLILLIGIVTAATLAFTVADLQRREGERRGREQRMTDRVADLAVLLNSAPRSLRPRLLGPGPEEPRWAATDAIPGTEDKDLTQRLAARLGAQAAEAFNAMQVRLKRHLAERTQMLAAITHDLQTPMTRQRLRLEKVSDPELQAQLLADQAAMLEMIRDGLDLARVAGSAEALQELDVDSLLQSLCEDAAELGVDVSIAARCECSVRTRPQVLKRCVSNLLDNALKYAGAAEMSAGVEGSDIAIRVSDRGPGIAPDQLDAVFEPFARLETSRSRETGGVGLGLTIARLLGERAGASLTLRAREGGGLEAMVLIQRS